MYGIFTYMWVIYGVNVGKYSIHGSSGIAKAHLGVHLEQAKRLAVSGVQRAKEKGEGSCAGLGSDPSHGRGWSWMAGVTYTGRYWNFM